MGMPDQWAVKLLRRLLRWNAEERITAQRALQHAFFRPGTGAEANKTPEAGDAGATVPDGEEGEGWAGKGYTCGTGTAEYEFADDAAATC